MKVAKLSFALPWVKNKLSVIKTMSEYNHPCSQANNLSNIIDVEFPMKVILGGHSTKGCFGSPNLMVSDIQMLTLEITQRYRIRGLMSVY